MKWRHFFLGAGAGFAAAYLWKISSGKTFISAEKALRKAKAALQKDGKITGSWIVSIPEVLASETENAAVYRGGITQIRGGKPVTYEFLADAKTGDLLKLEEIDP